MSSKALAVKSDLLDLVQGIPVDQKAKATPTIKSFLLQKIRAIQQNQNTILGEQIRRKQDEVLDSYRKSVGFPAKIKKLIKLRKQVEKMEEDILNSGLTDQGGLATIQVRVYGSVKTYSIYTGTKWDDVPAATAEKVEKVNELIKAVAGAVEPFTAFDQLETRMMLASTVGECMAIVNAVADRPVFEVKPELLSIADKK